MNKPRYKICVCTEDKQLVGYKADSFWTLSKEYAKLDSAVDGKLRTTLIDNLNSILKYGPFGKKSLNPKYWLDFETYLLGYEDMDGNRTFTHRIFPDEVQELVD